MKNRYQILTHMNNWYQIITDLKNWYLIVTDVSNDTEELESYAKCSRFGGYFFYQCEEYTCMLYEI